MSLEVAEPQWASSGDAAWNLWCQTIYDCITAAGWVNTADTGSTALPVAQTYPISSGFFAWWVFRMDDTEQGTAPIFIKVELGRGSSTNATRVAFTTGTGTNGSGTITGVVQAQHAMSTSGLSQSLTNPMLITVLHNEGIGFIGFNLTTTSGAFGMLVARTEDALGVPDSDGWISVTNVTASSNGNNFAGKDNVEARALVMAGIATFFPNTYGTTGGIGDGSEVPVFVSSMYFGHVLKRITGLYICSKYDFSHASEWTIDTNDGPHNFYAVGVNLTWPYGLDTLSSSTGLLLRTD